MTPDISILHEHENSEWSEQFLKDNGEKFAKQAVAVLRLLYQGKRLTAKNANDILNIADGGRRLREIFAAKKECKKEIRITNGKKEGVEYFLQIPQPLTKKEITDNWGQLLNNLKQIDLF